MYRRRKKRVETSKKMAWLILIICIIDLQAIIIAAYFDKVVPETIGVALVTQVIGVFGIYCLKSYSGKKKEAENYITKKINNIEEEEL